MRYALAALAFIAATGQASALDCEAFIKLHGFLSRAQFQCGFGRYAENMISQARDCSRHMNEARLKDSLTAGMKLFDARESERGHKTICASVLRDFPQSVAR